MIEYILLTIATFWLILTGISRRFNLEAKGVTLVPLVLLMVRTQKFLTTVNTLSEKMKSFWNTYASVGVAVSVAGIPFSLGYFAWNAYKVLSAPTEAVPVVPIIPGVTIKISWGLIIGIIILFFVHEFSHGIVARREGISLKSMGFILLVIIPGAFVEPDEEEMKKASRLTRIKVYSAGSLANFLVAALVFILLLWIPQVPDGILIYDTIPGTPAADILAEGSIIHQINGVDVPAYETFSQELSVYKKGDTLLLETSEGTVQMVLAEHPDIPGQGYMGIRPVQHVTHFLAIEILSWIFMLNLSVALFNLFPISRVLDGGKITDELLNHFFSEATSKKLGTVFAMLAVGILLINLLTNVMT
ncbi:MAG: site-2 protease family protein [Theionarchaea archaeon]|nr:site-2 protease family protein [Theionarchaea archaeon]